MTGAYACPPRPFRRGNAPYMLPIFFIGRVSIPDVITKTHSNRNKMDIFIKNIVDILKVEVPLSEEDIEGFIEIPLTWKRVTMRFPVLPLQNS